MEQLFNYLIANQFVTLLLVLPILVLLNIMLGRALADFKDEFDKAKFNLGFKKGFTVYIAILTLTIISKVIVISEVDIAATMLLILYIVNVSYIMQVIEKVKLIFDFKKASEIVVTYRDLEDLEGME